MLFKVLTRLWLTAAALMTSQYVIAGPMGFNDSYMAMGDFNNHWRESFINYAITPRDALGVGATYMRADDKIKTRTLEEVIYTRLLQRWNLPHAQANVWFIGGVGALQAEDKQEGVHHDVSKVMITPGIQFDYETTRVYFAATHRFYRASNINHDFTSARAGLSFYETDYDKTQPWLIVEARNMNGLSDKVEVTPMLRLVNKNFFVEAGVNNAREPRFNFMYIF
ncbi:hypothetical protein Meth11DRAFT_1600 [Methylophilaceae bacterium 11]|nr:hypothetical protein Meth11DRAFT_1600 [Methylophilaceae bacterium 11]